MPKERGGDEELVKTIPLRRVGEHIELANLAAFLVSDGAAYINGDAVVIDGGKMQSAAAVPARSRCSTGPTSNGGDPAEEEVSLVTFGGRASNF